MLTFQARPNPDRAGSPPQRQCHPDVPERHQPSDSRYRSAGYPRAAHVGRRVIEGGMIVAAPPDRPAEDLFVESAERGTSVARISM
jgi:hypothetical protein